MTTKWPFAELLRPLAADALSEANASGLIRRAFAVQLERRLAEAVSQQTGDLLLLDNMRTAHGRQSFEGPRRLLAGMAERHGQADTCVEM